MALHKIKQLYAERFIVCRNKSSEFRTIVVFKTFVKQNNNSNKTFRYVNNLLCTKPHLSKCNGI
jgi:hypothetical protein